MNDVFEIERKMKNVNKCSNNREEIGKLYVVATPIGNLEDITYRAVRILNEVDLIAAEDTRHTRKLLTHFGIKKKLVSYYKDRESVRSNQIIDDLLQGCDVALVSDAGTPAVSDPGAILVARCHEKNIPIVVVPGASALTATLSIAGLPQTSFVFLGFLPAKKAPRREILKTYSHSGTAVIFYESPRRILVTLEECRELMEERKIFIARELTKIHEELLLGTPTDLISQLREKQAIKGEFVVAVFPAAEDQKNAMPPDIEEMLNSYCDQSELSMKDAVKKISEDLHLSRSLVYEKALRVWGKK